MLVRLATIPDAAAIAHVHMQTWRIAYKEWMPPGVLASLDLEKRTAFWKERLRSSSGDIFVVENENQVIGFCDLISTRDEDATADDGGEFAAVYVLPEHSRKGAGRKLFDAALAMARTRNYRAVTLWTLKQNEPAHRFYEKMGFKPDGTSKKAKLSDGTEIDQVRYQLVLV